MYSLTGGAGEVVPTPHPLAPLLWTDDDWLYVQHVGAYTQIPTRVSRMHLESLISKKPLLHLDDDQFDCPVRIIHILVHDSR
jgi:hypothetical protein